MPINRSRHPMHIYTLYTLYSYSILFYYTQLNRTLLRSILIHKHWLLLVSLHWKLHYIYVPVHRRAHIHTYIQPNIIVAEIYSSLILCIRLCALFTFMKAKDSERERERECVCPCVCLFVGAIWETIVCRVPKYILTIYRFEPHIRYNRYIYTLYIIYIYIYNTCRQQRSSYCVLGLGQITFFTPLCLLVII